MTTPVDADDTMLSVDMSDIKTAPVFLALLHNETFLFTGKNCSRLNQFFRLSIQAIGLPQRV